MPKYKHDCTECKFLGTGKKYGLVFSDIDFYICGGNGLRTLIARYGDNGDEYTSSPLFICTTLTSLDQVALFNGLELTREEEVRLLKVLLRMYATGRSWEDIAKSATDIKLGKGNIYNQLIDDMCE
jgi:hypothetical protein